MQSYLDALSDYLIRTDNARGRELALSEIARIRALGAPETLATALAADEPATDRRIMRRYNMDHGVNLYLRGTPVAGQVLDMSQTGLKLVASQTLRPGELFRLRLADATHVNARVVWRSGEFYGAQFVSHSVNIRQLSQFIASNAF